MLWGVHAKEYFQWHRQTLLLFIPMKINDGIGTSVRNFPNEAANIMAALPNGIWAFFISRKQNKY